MSLSISNAIKSEIYLIRLVSNSLIFVRTLLKVNTKYKISYEICERTIFVCSIDDNARVSSAAASSCTCQKGKFVD